MKRYKFDAVTNFILDWFGGYVAWHNNDVICYKFKNKNVPSDLKIKYSIDDVWWYLEHPIILSKGKEAGMARGSGRTLHEALDSLNVEEHMAMSEYKCNKDYAIEDDWSFESNNKVIAGLAHTMTFLSVYANERIEKEFAYTGGDR